MENCINEACGIYDTTNVHNCPGGTGMMQACKKYLMCNSDAVAKSPAAMAGSAANAAILKMQISGILMDAIGGHKEKYRTPEGFIRWGVVEGDINETIDAVLR